MAQWNKSSGQSPVRAAVRFQLRLPMTITTCDGPLMATTEDISSNGLLFVSPCLPEVDSRIEFTILMPSAVMGSATDLRVYCFGRIVRHHIHGLEKKAAAVIDEYSLRARRRSDVPSNPRAR